MPCHISRITDGKVTQAQFVFLILISLNMKDANKGTKNSRYTIDEKISLKDEKHTHDTVVILSLYKVSGFCGISHPVLFVTRYII